MCTISIAVYLVEGNLKWNSRRFAFTYYLWHTTLHLLPHDASVLRNNWLQWVSCFCSAPPPGGYSDWFVEANRVVFEKPVQQLLTGKECLRLFWSLNRNLVWFKIPVWQVAGFSSANKAYISQNEFTGKTHCRLRKDDTQTNIFVLNKWVCFMST